MLCQPGRGKRTRGDDFGALDKPGGRWRLNAFTFQRTPSVVAAEVLPEALQPPDHMQLPIGKMLEEAVTDQARHILPIIIATIGDLLLQDRANRNGRREGVPKQKELE